MLSFLGRIHYHVNDHCPQYSYSIVVLTSRTNHEAAFSQMSISCFFVTGVYHIHDCLSSFKAQQIFSAWSMTKGKQTLMKGSMKMTKGKQTFVKSMKAKKQVPRNKLILYIRCTRCNSLREKLIIKKGYWSFKHEYCLDCGGALDLTTQFITRGKFMS
jgi:hypothetical protein